MDDDQQPAGLYHFVHFNTATGNASRLDLLLYCRRPRVGWGEWPPPPRGRPMQLWRLRPVFESGGTEPVSYELEEPCPRQLQLRTLVVSVEYMNRALLKQEPWSGFSCSQPIEADRDLGRGDQVPAAEELEEGEPWFLKNDMLVAARRMFTTLHPQHLEDPIEKQLRGIAWPTP